MSHQKINDKQVFKIEELKQIEEGYLNIIENTLKTFKKQKKSNIHDLNDIEGLLEHYKKELEYMNQKNKEMYNNVLNLIENKRSLHNKAKEDLKRTDKHIQLIQIQREL